MKLPPGSWVPAPVPALGCAPGSDLRPEHCTHVGQGRPEPPTSHPLAAVDPSTDPHGAPGAGQQERSASTAVCEPTNTCLTGTVPRFTGEPGSAPLRDLPPTQQPGRAEAGLQSGALVLGHALTLLVPHTGEAEARSWRGVRCPPALPALGSLLGRTRAARTPFLRRRRERRGSAQFPT